VARDRLIPLLAEGRGDIAAANLTITPERAAVVDFSRPYIDEVREVVVTGPGAPPLTTLDDLSGMDVHARRSSSYWPSLEALNAGLAARGLAPARLVAADEHLEDEDLLELVAAGSLPLAVVDDHKARFWASVLEGLEVREDLAVRTGGKIGWAMRKGTPELRKLVDRFLATTKRGTLVGNVLAERYLVDNAWARDPLASDAVKRFRRAAPAFRRFADRYAFDWRMVAAQAYQESRMDQSLRSPAGAIGVMQVLPSTAADPAVAVRDITKLENNIHAGVKYLRVVADTYFAEPGIDPRDRTLFAMAAYNAGPSRIAEARAEAERMGLDPDRWFDHVEHAAARLIGRETANYVRNVAKYYYAYGLVEASLPHKEKAMKAAAEQ
jgi:membrane-bound lytic murein transglycosylase MltF